jgi:hypothetical protein
MGILGHLLGCGVSAGAGGIFGLIANFATKTFSYLEAKQSLVVKQSEWAHETELLKLQAEWKQPETESAPSLALTAAWSGLLSSVAAEGAAGLVQMGRCGARACAAAAHAGIVGRARRRVFLDGADGCSARLCDRQPGVRGCHGDCLVVRRSRPATQALTMPSRMDYIDAAFEALHVVLPNDLPLRIVLQEILIVIGAGWLEDSEPAHADLRALALALEKAVGLA